VQSSTSSGGSYSTSTGAALTPTFGGNTSVSGGFTGSVTNYNASYTWGISTNSGSVSFGSPSGSTYPFTVSGLGSGASATITVTTSRTGYTGGSAQTTGTATTQVPVNTVAPTIAPTSGTAGVTTYSVTSDGSWTNSPTSYAYQWQYNDQGATYLSISGATSSSYSPPSNFFSLYVSPIRCRVTASNAGGAGTAAFSNTATVAAPVVTPTVSTITASTTGRSGTSPSFVFANPKATFNFTFTNTLSCTIHIDNSTDGITWNAGVANNLSVTSNAITLSTNLPSGTTSASGNYYYRTRVNAWSGATQTGNSTGLKTSSSVRNTATAINPATSLSFA
jgi:hypothetical protein